MKIRNLVATAKRAGLAAAALVSPLAMAGTNTTSSKGSVAMPWDTALTNLLDSVTKGTAPKIVGLAVVGAGIAAAAGDTGGLGKKLGVTAMAGGAALAGADSIISIFGALI